MTSSPRDRRGLPGTESAGRAGIATSERAYRRIARPGRLDMARTLGGVDVLYAMQDGTLIEVEIKVWEVADSLCDLVKLAAATQRGDLRGARRALRHEWDCREVRGCAGLATLATSRRAQRGQRS